MGSRKPGGSRKDCDVLDVSVMRGVGEMILSPWFQGPQDLGRALGSVQG